MRKLITTILILLSVGVSANTIDFENMRDTFPITQIIWKNNGHDDEIYKTDSLSLDVEDNSPIIMDSGDIFNDCNCYSFGVSAGQKVECKGLVIKNRQLIIIGADDLNDIGK